MKPRTLPITRLSFPLATAIAALLFPLLAGTANATVYWWDTNGTTYGLGTPNNTDTWGTASNVATNGNTVTAPANPLTTISDTLNFGQGGRPSPLGGGTIPIVAGGRSIQNIYFNYNAGSIALTGETITFGTAGIIGVANSSDSISSILAGAGTSMTIHGTGQLTLTGANTYAGPTTIYAGTVDLGGGGATGSLNSANALTLYTGTLNLTRNDSFNQNLTGGLTINAGASAVSAAANDTIQLGGITRTSKATVNFGSTGTLTTTTANTGSTTILGGWATLGGADWAGNNGTNIVAPSYVNDTWASGNNTTVTLATNPAYSNVTTDSLRFNAAAANTVTLDGANTLTTGGILVTPAVGNNLSTITGGTLQAGSGADLVVNQYDPFNGLTIASAIADNSTTALTKTGPGTLTLSHANTYAGVNNLWGGTVVVTNATALGTNATTTAVNMNPGTTLDLADASGLTTSYGVTLNALNTGYFNSGAGGSLSAGNNSYFTIQSGRATVGGGVNQTLGALTMNFPIGGMDVLNVTKDPKVNDANASVTFSSINVTGGGNGSNKIVLNPTTANVTVTGTVGSGVRSYLVLDGTSTGNQIQGAVTIGSGAPSLTKLNTGTWTLSGVNSYSGNGNNPAILSAGTLIVGGQNGVLPGPTNLGIKFLGTTANLTFDNTGASGAKNQTPGSLAFINQVGGDDTLTIANAATKDQLITWSSLVGTRGAGTVNPGATANFVNKNSSGNLVNSTAANGFVLTGQSANTFLDQGYFFNGANYAVVDGGGTLYVRAMNYTTDTSSGGATVSATPLTAGNSKHVDMTATLNGSGSGEASASPKTLRIGGAYDLTMAGGATLTLGNGGLLKTGGNASSISGGTISPSAEFVIRTDAGSDSLAISSIISGSRALTKSGLGTLDLSGNNSYTGNTFINAGTLQLGGAGDGTYCPLGVASAGSVLGANQINGTLTAAVLVSAGAALDLNGHTLSVAKTLNLNGGSLVNSSGTAATYSGSLFLSGGGPNPPGYVAIDSTINASGGDIILTNAGTLFSFSPSWGTGIFPGLFLDGTTSGSQVQSIIDSTIRFVTKNGSGTWTLTGANAYTGDTTVNAGTLSISQAYLADGADVYLTTGAALNLNTSGATDTIRSLYIDGVAQTSGVWGATGSGAAHTSALITGTGKLSVTTGPSASSGGYAAWASTHSGSGAPNEDANHDGVQNGVAYFMNATGPATNPGITGNSVTWPNGGNIPATDYGTQFVVQTSSDLALWTDVSLADLTTNTSGPAGSLTYTLPTGAGKLFVRLVVRPN